MTNKGTFEVVVRDTSTSARLGRLTTAHGVVETPVFMPVGSRGTVKAMAPDELEELGASMILGIMGRNRRMGAWGYFFASLVLTPIIGLILLLVSGSKNND